MLSEALFGINSGSPAEGKLADTLADRREEGVCLNTPYKLEKIEILTTAFIFIFCLFVRKQGKNYSEKTIEHFF